PALTPDAQLSDDRTERLACRRQVVLGSLAVQTCTAFQESRLLELTKALREQRRRHQRDSTLDVVEPFAARERELADHERRPPLGENLGCLSDGAELSVALHGRSMCASCSAIQLQILQWNARSGRAEVRPTWPHGSGPRPGEGEEETDGPDVSPAFRLRRGREKGWARRSMEQG